MCTMDGFIDHYAKRARTTTKTTLFTFYEFISFTRGRMGAIHGHHLRLNLLEKKEWRTPTSTKWDDQQRKRQFCLIIQSMQQSIIWIFKIIYISAAFRGTRVTLLSAVWTGGTEIFPVPVEMGQEMKQFHLNWWKDSTRTNKQKGKRRKRQIKFTW